MKELKKLKEVKVLSKKEQKTIIGGLTCYRPDGSFICGDDGCCINNRCVNPSLCL